MWAFELENWFVVHATECARELSNILSKNRDIGERIMKRLVMVAFLGITLFAALSTAPLEATPVVDIKFTGLSNGEFWTFDLNGAAAGGHVTGGGGVFNWTMLNNHVGGLGTPFPVANNDSFITFCIELVEMISVNEEVIYESIDPADAPIVNSSYGAMGNDKKLIMSQWFGNYWQGNSVSDWTFLEAQAFQLGLWEIVYEDLASIGDVRTGTFSYVGGGDNPLDHDDILDEVEDWFLDLDDTNTRHFFALSNPNEYTIKGGKQDQVTVPEPSTWVLIGAGVLAMARRKGLGIV